MPAPCLQLARSAWPATAHGRAQLLNQLESMRAECVEYAPFLAVLGAAWLDQGDPSQALLWLERALLLDPDALGARADHALALAALGEGAALLDLVQHWRDRTDIPLALQNRLIAALARQPAAPIKPAGMNGGDPLGWSWRRELGLFYGRETNLDHSPRLTELTLSAPDGPIELPLAIALEPRPGRAWLAEGGFRGQYKASADVAWQSGLQFTARHSPTANFTDQHQVQLQLARVQQHGDWSSHLNIGAGWQGGPLSEPYRTWRAGMAAEHRGAQCSWRGALDIELRRQKFSAMADGNVIAAQANIDCALPWAARWTWGLALRGGVDSPRFGTRAGAAQRQVALGLRLAGPIGAGVQLEATARQSWLKDQDGYSPLLESNARRSQTQQFLSVELSRPIQVTWLPDSEAVLQLQQLRQDSNLKLFSHNGASAFAGLRWAW